MYSKEQILELQKQTKDLVAANHTEKAFEIVEQLRKVLQFHEYRYYVLNDPLISDVEYDQLFKLLEKIEQANPELITAGSPTQRVGNSLNASFKTVSHLVPMLSLENSYNADNLIDWDRKAREVAKLDELEYCVEPKFDGASISLIYENDHLIRGATRGNGLEGDDITTNIKQIRSVPLTASFSDFGIYQVEIRGEMMMSKKAFKQYNEHLAEQNIRSPCQPKKRSIRKPPYERSERSGPSET
jgi:DNA ligase (NAD+)